MDNKVLGKGLSALIPEKAEQISTDKISRTCGFYQRERRVTAHSSA